MEAKYKSTLMEKKLITLGLSKMKLVEGKLVATMTAGEVRAALDYHGNSLYKKLKNLSAMAIQHYMFIKEDDQKQEFTVSAVVDRVDYKNGVLRIYFNDAIKAHTIDVERKYTIVPRNTLMSIKSNTTFTLYDLLMTHYYQLTDNDILEITYGLNELKFSLGLVNIYDPKISEALNSGMDYDDIVDHYLTHTDKDGNKIVDIPYNDWYNFRRRVIEPSKKEIDNSDLVQFTFDYKGLTAGKGGKTVAVTFYLKKKAVIAPSRKAIEKENQVTNESLQKLMGASNGQLSSSECVQLLAKADNDCDKVIFLFNYTQKNRRIQNPVGWIISALDGNWDIPADYGRNQAENRFGSFHQRDYDYEQLELDLLSAQQKKEKETSC